jgi:hypothetical protein
MMTEKTCYRKTPTGIALDVKVIPRASRSEVAGVTEGRLRVRVAAPPVDGEANLELIEALRRYIFTASGVRVKKSAIRILKGRTSRSKVVEIDGVEGIQLI